ncbi:MAG: hypothetical protein KAT43_04490 [Nanoarchaeota archaeon]|nr:hypothetical protein [Nanoarchaeota archaeon]
MNDFKDLSERTKGLNPIPNGDAESVSNTAMERALGLQNLIREYQIDTDLIGTIKRLYGFGRVIFLETEVKHVSNEKEELKNQKPTKYKVTFYFQYEPGNRFGRRDAQVRFFMDRESVAIRAFGKGEMPVAKNLGELAERKGLEATRSKQRGYIDCKSLRYIANQCPDVTPERFKEALYAKLDEDITARGA